MKARTLTIKIVLLDLKHAFSLLLREKHKNTALLSIYAFIDICAALANDRKTENQEIFKAYLQKFTMLSGKPFTAYDLWAARCSLLHAFSPFGRHTEKLNGAKPIFYYSWTEKREEVENALVIKGYSDFILLNVEDVKWVAIEGFNNLFDRIETDEAFESQFLKNAKDLLFDLQAYKLEDELSMLEAMAKKVGNDA